MHELVAATYSQDQNPYVVYLASLSENSRPTAVQSLNRVAELLGFPSADVTPWHMLRFQHTQAIRQRLIEHYQPPTARKIISFIKGVLLMAKRLELISGDDYLKAIDIPGIKGENPPPGRYLSQAEIGALMRVCADDPKPAGARDAALIAVMVTTGMRVGETVSLNLDDYVADEHMIQVRLGKGKRHRRVPVVGSAEHALTDWLELRGKEPGRLFTRMSRQGHVTLDAFTTQAVVKILRKRGDEAGLRPFTPHDLRRTLVSWLLERGVSVLDVQRITGHQRPETVGRYDRRGDEVSRTIARDHLHIPYFGRKEPAHEH